MNNATNVEFKRADGTKYVNTTYQAITYKDAYLAAAQLREARKAQQNRQAAVVGARFV